MAKFLRLSLGLVALILCLYSGAFGQSRLIDPNGQSQLTTRYEITERDEGWYYLGKKTPIRTMYPIFCLSDKHSD
jgi:hypothetical protein